MMAVDMHFGAGDDEGHVSLDFGDSVGLAGVEVRLKWVR